MTQPTAQLEFVDTHAHLDEPAFDVDREAVVVRAGAAGVRRIVNIGYRPARWATSAALARAHPSVSLVLGLHPQDADEMEPSTIQTLADEIARVGAIGVGETGLDFFRPGYDEATQRRAFSAQLELAASLKLPVVIHQRAAESACRDVLAASPRDLRIVLHSFDGTQNLARLALDRGYYFGVGGLMTRTSAAGVRAILTEVPMERLLLETDSPYLTPSGVKTRRNEPAHIPTIAARLADLRGDSIETIARVTTDNAVALFGLPLSLEPGVTASAQG